MYNLLAGDIGVFEPVVVYTLLEVPSLLQHGGKLPVPVAEVSKFSVNEATSTHSVVYTSGPSQILLSVAPQLPLTQK